jgi:hypothetical protein
MLIVSPHVHFTLKVIPTSQCVSIPQPCYVLAICCAVLWCACMACGVECCVCACYKLAVCFIQSNMQWFWRSTEEYGGLQRITIVNLSIPQPCYVLAICCAVLWCACMACGVVCCVCLLQACCVLHTKHMQWFWRSTEEYGGLQRITTCEFEHFSTLLRACHMLCCSVVCRPWPTKPDTTGLPSKPSCGRTRDSETAPTYVKVTRGRLDAPPYTLCPFFGFRARVNK